MPVGGEHAKDDLVGELPLTQADWRRLPSGTNPARVAAAIIAALSASVSAWSRCSPRMAKP